MSPLSHLSKNQGDVSLGEIAVAKLSALAEALDLPDRELQRVVSLFEELSTPWAGLPSGEVPPWPSDISDDGTPFEFSVAFDRGEPKLRLLVEAQATRMTATSTFEAGLALNRRLAADGKADLEMFERIVDLFEPGQTPARFQLWHAAELGAEDCLYKAYLNPQVLGASAAPDLLRQALERLGMQPAWEMLSRHLTRPEDRAELRYVSVDLKPASQARIKVYLGRSSADAVEELVAGVLPAGQAREWLRELTGFEGPYLARPVLTCFSFRVGDAEPEATLHVPVRCYVPNDAEAADRAGRYLPSGDAAVLTRALRAIAGRPLRMGRGLLTYVSLRAAKSGLRVTSYIAPEVYSIGAQRPAAGLAADLTSERRIRVRVPEPTTMGAVQDIIARRQALLSQHAFLKRLEGPGSIEDVRAFVPRLSFFIMVFQDVLRLVSQTCVDPELRAMTRSHALEDSGHELWFLSDLEILGIPCDVRGVFSQEYALTRDVAYSLVAEVIHASSDFSRLAVSFSLEAAAAEFFGRVIGFLDRMGQGKDLQYFARKHQMAEAAHDVFEDDGAAGRLAAFEIRPSEVSEVLAAVDKSFESMTLLADDLALAMGVEPRAHSAMPLAALPARPSSAPPSRY